MLRAVLKAQCLPCFAFGAMALWIVPFQSHSHYDCITGLYGLQGHIPVCFVDLSLYIYTLWANKECTPILFLSFHCDVPPNPLHLFIISGYDVRIPRNPS